jgi:hypothetical protein
LRKKILPEILQQKELFQLSAGQCGSSETIEERNGIFGSILKASAI